MSKTMQWIMSLPIEEQEEILREYPEPDIPEEEDTEEN